MNYFNFFVPTIIMIIACILLVRQCLKPFFIDPTKVVKKTFIYNNYKKINMFGKIITLLTVFITCYFFIVPTVQDTICIINNNYNYAIAETCSSYKISNSSSKHGTVNFILHPEFMYNPKDNTIVYKKENKDIQKKTIKISMTNYKKGEYYLIKFLPNSGYGELICFIENIEEYK